MSTIPPILHGHSWRTDTIEGHSITWREVGASVSEYTFRNCDILIDDTHETELSNCRFINCRVMMMDVWDATISNCQFVLGTLEHVPPLSIDSNRRQTNSIRIDNCRFENNQSAVNVAIIGPNVREVVIERCKFHSKKESRKISHIVAEQVNMLTVRHNKFTSGDQQPRDIGATFRDCTDWRFDGNTCESLEAWLVIEKQRRQGFRFTRDNVEPLGRKCREQVREVR